jgi:tetratricopeptide (TPR) repeat protein
MIGDLLVRAGMISGRQLDEAMRLAGNKHVHLGQMLVIARYLTNRELTIAVDAQSAVRDRVVDVTAAVNALKIACRHGVSFAEALNYNAPAAPVGEGTTSKLGELLLESNVITSEQLDKAMQRSLSTGLPLGRILVLNGAINEPLLTAVLEIQVRVRDGMMEREEALDYLRSIGNNPGDEAASVEQAFQIQAALKSPRGKPIRVGELLVLAGILNESDVVNALELALSHDMPIGEVIVNQGFISPQLLEAALKLQRMIEKDLVTGPEAADTLREIQANGGNLDNLVGLVDGVRGASGEFNVETLLTSSHLATQEDIDAAFESARQDPELIVRILSLMGYISEPAANATFRCFCFVADNYLSAEDAVVALDYCLQKQSESEMTFDEALLELGWSVDISAQPENAEPVEHEGEVQELNFEAGHPIGELQNDHERAFSFDPNTTLTSSQTFESIPALVNTPGQLKQILDESGHPLAENGHLTGLYSQNNRADLTLDGESEEILVQMDEHGKIAGIVEEHFTKPSAGRNSGKRAHDSSFAGKSFTEMGAVGRAATASSISINALASGNAKQPQTRARSPRATFSNLISQSSSRAATASLVPDAPSAPAPGKRSERKKRASKPGSTTKSMTLKHLLESYADSENAESSPGQPTPPEEGAPQSTPPSAPVKRVAEKPPEDYQLTQEDELIIAAASSLEATPAQIKAAASILGSPSKRASGAHQPVNDSEHSQQNTSAASANTSTREPSTQKQGQSTEAGNGADEINETTREAFARLAESHFEQGRYAEAEKVYLRILNFMEMQEDQKSPAIVSALNSLAGVLCVQEKFGEAELYMQRFINIVENQEPDNILKLADGLSTLAGIYYQQDKLDQCGSLLERALRLKQRALGEDHADLADVLRDYAKLLKRTGRAEEAEVMYAQARAIIDKTRQEEVP